MNHSYVKPIRLVLLIGCIHFKAGCSSTSSLETKELVVEGARPAIVEGQCILCHGPKEQIEPAL